MSHRISARLALAAAVLATLAVSAPAEAAECDGLGTAETVVCEVNDVRTDRGLRALETDRRLHRAAAAHARDMASRQYFSHVTPEGERLADRLREAGYITGRESWRVGETLAWGRRRLASPAAAVAAWMRSAPHRRVLLGSYREIGVGIADRDPFGGGGTTFAADLGVLGG